MKLRWTRRAATQATAAAEYLEDARPGYGEIFLDELQTLAATVAKHSERFPQVSQVDGEVRRALIQRFGYWIVYERTTNEVVVLSVWHGRQREDGWK